MKLAALCCTYLRPGTLGQLIESFLRQDYPKELRELIILDDAGQYANQEGDGWRLISVPRRFHSLGEKRNACAALAAPDVDGFLVADDDDIYLPHWFKACALALGRAEWSRPSLVLIEEADKLKEHDTHGLFHGGWAFRREAFYRVRGYGAIDNGEDQELAGRLKAAGITQCDPATFAPPFYIYRVENGSYHLSYMGDQGYRELATPSADAKATFTIGWPRDYSALPVIRRYAFGAHIAARDGGMPVELIGPINAPGGDGPSNGMYALQKALQKRIADGLDWLSIKPLPASKGALPWFWHWDDRRYAAWWDSEGMPFVQGPNMLFTFSGSPRIDFEECALLDARNCRAMFCHSEWYRDLIAKHRGPANTAPIHLWPYPIDPWPGEPLPDEYDLLIYAKNGHRPGLLEHLAELFPRHIKIHYGQYRREQLYDAARKSRACAYLADDDHGPLALQEILLAGCPVVGVRTGAAFVQHGVTGMLVDRLPPGRSSITSDGDQIALHAFVQALTSAMALQRDKVRHAAAGTFATDRVADTIIGVLAALRTGPVQHLVAPTYPPNIPEASRLLHAFHSTSCCGD